MRCRRRRIGPAVLLLSVPVLLSGCGSTGDRGSAARAAAAAIEKALENGDAASVCAVLAPGTRSELESSEKAPAPT